jgi:hypothetical protein
MRQGRAVIVRDRWAVQSKAAMKMSLLGTTCGQGGYVPEMAVRLRRLKGVKMAIHILRIQALLFLELLK